jgi:surface antigen
MKFGLGRTLVWGVFVALVLIAPGGRALAGNCVLYARAETGVSLFGAAGGWWDEAAGLYQRGHVPEIGSILVFRRTGHMRSGHVAVVSKVIGPGQILVDQSNWYHGRVTRGTPVIDTSPDHDWTSVAVMNIASGEFGRDSPTFGFVYPETGAPSVADLARPASYQPETRADLFHFAVAEDGWRSRVHPRRGARSGHRSRYARHGEHRMAATGKHRGAAGHTAHHSTQASRAHATHGSAAHASRHGNSVTSGHHAHGAVHVTTRKANSHHA